ncbi:septal ring lytic transglycosylase RlpA family protein [Actinomadura kijaniata]|uniref:septal ring lytic transglycosylase RlpA family protein n=1 Tax=Actinomadura kijaniata TaxID=46161 RepID=UPI000A94D51A|nr:septal ring lytic transglycosylase RlpA family protein [Actinomadura kijaniata]
MGIFGTPRPAKRLPLILVASGVAVAVIAAGAIALLTSASGSTRPAAAAQNVPAPTAAPTSPAAPLADAPRPTPTRASRGKERAPRLKEIRPRPSSAAKKKPAKPRTRVVGGGSCEASYYWEGQMTASGERFDPSELTAAHKTLPMGSKVRVTNKNNGRSVTVRINDRGPFVSGRCLDLSKAAMTKVGGTGSGVIPVRYQVLARA